MMSQVKFFSIFALTGKSIKDKQIYETCQLVITSIQQVTEEFHDQLYNASQMKKKTKSVKNRP